MPKKTYIPATASAEQTNSQKETLWRVKKAHADLDVAHAMRALKALGDKINPTTLELKQRIDARFTY